MARKTRIPTLIPAYGAFWLKFGDGSASGFRTKAQAVAHCRKNGYRWREWIGAPGTRGGIRSAKIPIIKS